MVAWPDRHSAYSPCWNKIRKKNNTTQAYYYLRKRNNTSTGRSPKKYTARSGRKTTGKSLKYDDLCIDFLYN